MQTEAQKAVSRKNGGARRGSGRKLGAATKKTREIADRLVADGGITPLEVILQSMRAAWGEAITTGKVDLSKVGPAVEYAQMAAPYVHPRLASIQGNPDKPIVFKDEATILDAARRLAFVLRAGVMQIPREPRTLEHAE